MDLAGYGSFSFCRKVTVEQVSLEGRQDSLDIIIVH
jgi:hypothetical protein